MKTTRRKYIDDSEIIDILDHYQVTGAALFGARGTGAFVSRKARLTYGVRGSRRFDHNDPEHVSREEVSPSVM